MTAASEAKASRGSVPRLAIAQPTTIALLGPRPKLGPLLAELAIAKRVAVIRAGHQEDESQDGELMASLGVPAVNLRLHARATEVFATDSEFSTAYQARQQRLRNIQTFYRLRLEKTDEAAHMIAVRYVEPDLLAQEDAISVEQLRQLDGDHLARCAAHRAGFDTQWPARDRPTIARHRRELAEQLADCSALLIAGGHVASLFNRMEMFDVLELARGKPIIAWSGGAMVLTERIVLFHDFPPYGSDIAQVLDAGFARTPGVVVLPDPRRRLRLDDRDGIARFVRRMAPARVVAMASGNRLIFEHGKLVTGVAAELTATGAYERREAWP